MSAVSVSPVAPLGSTSRRQALLGFVANPTIAWTLLGVLLFLVWGPRLLRSFWVDEAGTYWMACQGPLAAIQRTWHWPGQSVLYAVIESFFCLHSGPLREIVLRIPSLIGMAMAGYFTYRFAEELIGNGAGFLVATMFLLNPFAIEMGTQARPYALASAAVAASSLALTRWMRSRSRKDLVTYVIASIFIVYLHYLFATVICVHILYILFVFIFERRISRWPSIVAAYAIIAVASMPLAGHMKLLLREGHTLPFLSTAPNIGDLSSFILHPVLALGIFFAAFAIPIIFGDCVKQPMPVQRSILFLLLAWLFLIPAAFFAVSTVTVLKIFVARYISFAIEADALLLAAAGFTAFTAWPGRAWALLAVMLSTASPLAIRSSMRPGREDLKPFMDIIRAESKVNPPPPVFFRSELPESTVGDWRSGLGGDGHLYAPFVFYPMPNRLIPLPFHFTNDAKTFISQTIDSQLRNVPEVIFVTHEQSWDRWMIERMRQAGFRPANIYEPNAFTVIVFKKP